MSAGDPDVGGELLIDRASKPVWSPMRRHGDTSRLPPRMHAGVGSSRTGYPNRCVCEPGQRFLQHTLHGARRRLHLPPGEIRSIVLNNELDYALRHCREIIRCTDAVQAKNARSIPILLD
jgi:hypothetical protein